VASAQVRETRRVAGSDLLALRGARGLIRASILRFDLPAAVAVGVAYGWLDSVWGSGPSDVWGVGGDTSKGAFTPSILHHP